MTNFPTTAEGFSPQFLSEVLGCEIAACSTTSIGEGLVGDSLRLDLTYADSAQEGLDDTASSGTSGASSASRTFGFSRPSSLAAKIPARDETSRSTATALQLYEKEVGFYRDIAPHTPIRTPHIYFAEFDPATSDFLILMEDCGPATQGDQLLSCNLEQAQFAVEQIAALHGKTFEQSQFLSLPFLQPNDQTRAFAQAGYPGASEKFCATYQEKLAPDLLDIVRQIAARSDTLFGEKSPSGPCVIHGDFRLDNILFDIGGGAEPMVTLDWQTVTPGHPLIDLGYFMGAGIGSTLRRPNEDQLLDRYAAALAQHGGPDLGDIRASHYYARGAIHGVTTAVFSAAFVEHNQRSEDIFLSMARGAAELCQALDAVKIWEQSVPLGENEDAE